MSTTEDASGLEHAVIQYAEDHPLASIRDVATALAVSPNLLKAHLSHLKHRGALSVDSSGRVSPGTSSGLPGELTPDETALLERVSEHPGSFIGELTDALGQDRGAVIYLVEELADLGYLRPWSGSLGVYVNDPTKPTPGAATSSAAARPYPKAEPPRFQAGAPGSAGSDRRYVGDAAVGGRTISRILDALVYWVAGITAFFLASGGAGFLIVIAGIAAILYGTYIFLSDGSYWVSSAVYVVALLGAIVAFSGGL